MESESASESEHEHEHEHEYDSDHESEREEWTQVEEDLLRLSILYQEACERMTALNQRLSQQGPSQEILTGIQRCHEESLKELEVTGEVSFGRRLLALFHSQE
jgi:hypothetical protein